MTLQTFQPVFSENKKVDLIKSFKYKDIDIEFLMGCNITYICFSQILDFVDRPFYFEDVSEYWKIWTINNSSLTNQDEPFFTENNKLWVSHPLIKRYTFQNFNFDSWIDSKLHEFNFRELEFLRWKVSRFDEEIEYAIKYMNTKA